MKLAGFVITAVVVGLSGPAFAQSGSEGSGSTAATTPATVAAKSAEGVRGFVVSGFLGTNFGASRNNTVNLEGIENLSSNNSTSVNFGGQIAYLARGVVGGEFLADFSPGDGTFNNVLFTKAPDMNSYMFNLVAAAPFGHAHRVDPYISGGIGEVSLHSTIFTVVPVVAPVAVGGVAANNAVATESVSGSKFGWDLGFGIMAWSARNWGLRADMRYYKTGTNSSDTFDENNIGDGSAFSRVELSGISVWKANIGVGFRW
jgi:opacity protein-like surface antigen